ncbi:MAG: hypothetical protein GXY14_02020 [Spirochaetes bacterium]|nr:hypothetical protein [Spirochaetota bacterium]
MQQINKELDENKDIIKTFSSAETKEVNDRINEKIQKADRVSRRNESKAAENASKTFVTF